MLPGRHLLIEGSTYADVSTVREEGLRSLRKSPSSCDLPGLGVVNNLRKRHEGRGRETGTEERGKRDGDGGVTEEGRERGIRDGG